MAAVRVLAGVAVLAAAAFVALISWGTLPVAQISVEPSGDGTADEARRNTTAGGIGHGAAHGAAGLATERGGGQDGGAGGKWNKISLGLFLPLAVVFLALILSRRKDNRRSRWHEGLFAANRSERGRPRRPIFIGAMIGRYAAGLSGKRTERCPNCGADLPCNAPHGLCPKCLLQEALSSPDEATPPRRAASTGPYAGTGAIPPTTELAQYFPQLEILGLLGQGGMGAVYKARQVKLDRLVALKILPPSAGQDPAFAERFMREARALARVSHPQIVAVHDFGETGGMFYFLMEYVDGPNLRQLMQSSRMPPEQALPIVGQICDALQYAHEEGIIHRDIKPENILLDQKGRVKIADFGLAKIIEPSPAKFTLTGSRQAMGTPHYMAPEQIERPQTVDRRADIYSLGVLLYEMLTGELPLGHFALPSQKAAVEERLDAVVLRALAKDPEQRYQRVSELKTDITGTGAVAAPVAAPVAVPIAPHRSYEAEVEQEVQRLRLVAPGACLIMSGVLVFGNLLFCLLVLLFPHGKFEFSFVRDLQVSEQITLAAVIAVAGLIAGIVISGGKRMMNLDSYGLAVFSSVLAMLASFPFVFIVGMPLSLRAFMALRAPEVKLAFAHKSVRARLSNPSIARPDKPGRIRSMLGAFRSLVLGSRVQDR